MRKYNCCRICGGLKSALIHEHTDLMGSTSKANSLTKFQIIQCSICGHIQKEIDDKWIKLIENLYLNDYESNKVFGRQINFQNGKIVSRDSFVASYLDNLLMLPERGDILDIGCGTGRFLGAFKFQKPHWNMTGFDVGNMYESEIKSIPDTEFYFGETNLSKINKKFDFIILSHVLEHLLEPLKILNTAKKLLKKTGFLIVRVPSFEKVNTDFFLMEHCSHFTKETLNYLLEMAGFKTYFELDDLAPIEIGYACKIDNKTKAYVNYNSNTIAIRAESCLAWASSIPSFIKRISKESKVGIFGVGGAGLWLSVLLKDEISFFIDEDIGKQGSLINGIPIISPEQIPLGFKVIVPFNNPEAAKNLYTRLNQSFPNSCFIYPI